MNIINCTIELKTSVTLDFIDITDKIQEIIKNSNINSGIINIQSLHTTMEIIINENEPLLISDMKKILDRLAPRDIKYEHDDFSIRTLNMCDDECRNGHSHCKALFLSTSQVLNIVKNKIQLGKWQRIFTIELDRSRDRQIAIQIIGT